MTKNVKHRKISKYRAEIKNQKIVGLLKDTNGVCGYSYRSTRW